MDHLDLLLQSTPNDAELQALRATYLSRQGNYDEAVKYSFKLIGYDPKADKFDIKAATAPNRPEVYTNLATTLAQQTGQAGAGGASRRPNGGSQSANRPRPTCSAAGCERLGETPMVRERTPKKRIN